MSRRLPFVLVLAVALLGGCGGAGSETTTTASGGSSTAMRLTPTGIGSVDFGTPPDETLAAFTAQIGGRSGDYDWTADPIFGACPGVLTRGVAWGSFVALFSEDASGVQEFFAWTYGYDPEVGTSGEDSRDLGLRTIEEIGLGATRAELRAAYGDRLVETEDLEIEVWAFTIDPDQTHYLRGLLSGPGDDATVIVIESSPGCETREA